jgi:hypothetical protein
MSNKKRDSRLDARDELILVVFALIVPLATVPVLLGFV